MRLICMTATLLLASASALAQDRDTDADGTPDVCEALAGEPSGGDSLGGP